MITYVYVVKCPNCEDEFFDFFDEAKQHALECLSKQPIITQTEVTRNDFGECTDHCDLGTVWSWEDMMKDTATDAEPAKVIFTKDDFAGFEDAYNPENDPEFYELDNSIEDEIDEISDDTRKPIPEGMTIEELVEAMEENEDTVECTGCGNLVEKANCTHNKEGFGWCCTDCAPADTLIESRDDLSLEELVADSINHLTNDLGKDPWADDFADDVIADLENNYDIYVPEDMAKYGNWCRNVASEVSRQVNRSERASFLEELEDSDTYRNRLDLCPECGTEKAFDKETGFCIECGFNL